MRQALMAVCLVAGSGVAALADTDPVDEMLDAMHIAEILDILETDGRRDAQAAFVARMPDRDPTGFNAVLDDVFAPERVVASLRQAFTDRMEPDQISEVTTFFTSDIGQTIVTLEIAARRAMSVEDIEIEARRRWDNRRDADDRQTTAIRRFAEVNQLVDRNVTSAMNARLQFFFGLSDSGGSDLTRNQILSIVGSDAPAVREDTENWVMAFLLLAYGPLEIAEIEAYIAFSQTPAGVLMNAALFEGFEQVFEDVSFDLGIALGTQMASQDI